MKWAKQFQSKKHQNPNVKESPKKESVVQLCSTHLYIINAIVYHMKTFMNLITAYSVSTV